MYENDHDDENALEKLKTWNRLCQTVSHLLQLFYYTILLEVGLEGENRIMEGEMKGGGFHGCYIILLLCFFTMKKEIEKDFGS